MSTIVDWDILLREENLTPENVRAFVMALDKSTFLANDDPHNRFMVARFAAESGLLDVIETLYPAEFCAPDYKDARYMSIVIEKALDHRHADVAKYLIQHPLANAEVLFAAHCYLLHAAATHGQTEPLALLLSRLQELSRDIKPEAGLDCDPRRGLEKGKRWGWGVKAMNESRLNKGDQLRKTPISLAAEFGHYGAAQLLAKTGAVHMSVGDHMGNTPLHHGVASLSPEIVALLLGSGADPRKVNKVGETPLQWAAKMWGDLRMTAGVGEDEFSNIRSIASLLVVVEDAGLGIANKFGQTPMHHACGDGNQELALLLARAGASLDARDADGMRPRDYVASATDLETLELAAEEAHIQAAPALADADEPETKRSRPSAT